ncbi:MAG: Ig-like domain-containing protein, partial [Plesiomonas sp.]
SSVASVVVLSLLLTACNSDNADNSSFLDPARPELPTQQSRSLTAFPQIFELNQGETQRVDLTQSVVANKIPSWEIARLDDKTALGEISGQTATAFSYLAQNAGIAQIDYGVQGDGLSASSTVAIAISETTFDNHSPQAQDVQLLTPNNASVSIDLSGKMSDIDNDPLTLALYGSPRFTLNGTQVTFAPNGFVGVDHAIYSVEDGKGGYTLANIVAISEDANPPIPNQTPTAQAKSFILDAATTATLSFDLAKQQLIKDEDGDALTIAHIFTTNNRATTQGTTGIVYAPDTFRGVDHFTYVVTDGKGGYAMNAITVTVNDSTLVNDKPTAAPVATTIPHNVDTHTILISDAVDDPDGDELGIVRLSGALGQASISPTDPLTILYKPNNESNDFVGTDRFVYIVSDKKGGYAMSEIAVTVTDTPPVANMVQTNTLLDTPIAIDLSAYIFDAETQATDLKISNITPATSPATVELNGQTLIYTPNGFTGNDILTYTVSDGRHSTDGTIVITVNEHDAHPIEAQDIDLPTAVDSPPLILDLSDKIQSPSAPTAEFTVISVAGNVLGEVTISNNILTYTPKPGVYGNDAFVYTVKDNHTPAHYAQGKVTVEITAPPIPEITELKVQREADDSFKTNVTCADCTQYQYTWIINGLTVGTGETYSPTAADNGFNIRLEVTGQ